MTYAVVTTFSPKGYEVYGRRMLNSFARFWPEDIEIYAYYEGKRPSDAHPRAQWRSLDDDTDRAAFMAAHKDHPTDYRLQPVKFCHKVFAVTSAPRTTDWLIWLDGDIETEAPVTHELLKSVTPDDVVASYLGRKWWNHTETGFVAYNLDYRGQSFLDGLRAIYTTGHIMKLPQKHDCAAFDDVREHYEDGGLPFLDLGKDFKGPGIDVMAATPLGKVMWHNKGEGRKLQAYGAVA